MTREEAFNLTPGETIVETEETIPGRGARVGVVVNSTKDWFEVQWQGTDLGTESISQLHAARILQLQRGGPPATGLAPEEDAAAMANLHELED